MDLHRGGYGQLKGEWVNGFIFDLSFRGFASRGKVMRINEMIPKGKSYHLQSNRPFVLVDHVINFRST